MPNPLPIVIPPDAMEKIEAKGTVDYYAELTDEERAEEGLPPRETPKTDAPPADEPVVADPEKKPDAAADDDEPASDEAIDKLFAEIAGLSDKIDERLEKPAPAKTEKEIDARLKAALESDDEDTQYLAQQLQGALERVEKIESAAREDRVQRQMSKDDADFEAVQSTHLIDGKPMTDDQVTEVEKFMEQYPEVGSRLSIEQLTRVVFPSATKAPKSPPAKGPGASPNGDGTKVATIVDTAAGGGGGPTKFTPRANENVESAIGQFAKDVGWKR